mmetsp:Transcript_32208/g.37133  ORF Transcript_32208/g.37133 Transcript_32208/m.37133 type:complete len:110 (+) Transcript_32208:28-357(+)|eukprot:CAMPEP_0176433306 /NCGR_PEP_ID=MMETSP0127-20121128/15936_1 /TAXON_ID=938130 /ORGANISM="Platyophrya macrostoma, Strain WH" /LENGTH=109 /DNA_ID=CAMNT_0017815693 /DNA_START=28 /DNA_END=357 /DNA_ORIENTATION=+
MRVTLIVCLIAAALLASAQSATITQQWYTDSACSQNEEISTVVQGQCYLDSADYSGVQWECAAGGTVVGIAYSYGDVNCTGSPLGKKVFAEGQCVGPVFSNLYLIASGC